MGQLVFIAVAAGFASALMAATIASGGGLAMPLVLLAPLPLIIVSMGWHPLVAAIGGALTVAALAFFFRGSTALVFAVLVALPAYAFGAIAWRGGDHARDGTLSGRMMMAALLAGAFATVVGALSVSFSYAEFEAQLMRQAEATLRYMMQVPREQPLPRFGGTDADAVVKAYAAAVPVVTTAMLGFVYLLNVYVAGRVARQSGRLPVEWPDVPSLAAPRLLLPVTAVLLLLMALPGYMGLFAEVLGITGLLAITLVGFATVHFVSRGWPGRPVLLTLLWCGTVVFGVPAIIMLLVGIVELSFGLRRRKAAGGPPTQVS
jgi:hypothetical protein